MRNEFKNSKYYESGKRPVARMSPEQKTLIEQREQEAKDRLRIQMMKSFGITIEKEIENGQESTFKTIR